MRDEGEKKTEYYCNPLNVSYRYQFNADPLMDGKLQICREAADPSMILFKGRYYIFASMTLAVWVSDDLAHWESHRLPDGLPLYDYAPDARVMGEWVYLCASNREHNCDHWRTKDILNGPYERIEGTFPFWDPNLFVDDDGRVYFYWGCSNETPIYGVELDAKTMRPKTAPQELVAGHPEVIGYERRGEDHCLTGDDPMARPYIEGAWMDKRGGRYYLQYAAPGTQYNIYADGVYVSESPLGPFRLAENSPYSYKPGGFLPGAGHGSTMRDRQGRWWHAATMRISQNHRFERRVGIWPAGFDKDGELFCDQRYSDWPMAAGTDPWREPPWMLLSVGKAASASSCAPGHEAGKATEENVQTWWRAATAGRDEWLCVDLGAVYDIHAVQINFADDGLDIPCPGRIRPGAPPRYIDEAQYATQWRLEGSQDGNDWFVVEDKTDAPTDLPHDLVVRQEGFAARYLRLSDMAVPYGQVPCISALRVFGLGEGEKPAVPAFSARREGELDMTVDIHPQGEALGYNILFGGAPEKLYHSYMVFTPGEHRIGALIKGRQYYVRVDAFNENGITEGVCAKV